MTGSTNFNGESHLNIMRQLEEISFRLNRIEEAQEEALTATLTAEDENFDMTTNNLREIFSYIENIHGWTEEILGSIASMEESILERLAELD